MVKHVRIDYQARRRPGIPVIVCEKDGRIIYQHEGMKPGGRTRAWQRHSLEQPSKAKALH